ncbi:MAG: GH39 family glycosyl hydrolase [Spirochaetales bacterium]
MDHITANPKERRDPLRHPWSKCITVGRAYELLRADLQQHLRFLKKELDFTYIRFHASFHDDVGVVQRDSDGGLRFRWTQLDHIYDFLVDAGFDPIVEINPMPQALASGEQKMFWYGMNVTPPASYDEWEQFIGAWVAHIVERYGLDCVRRWYFEVWNEPDLSGFWSSTMEEYYRLYASCARVIKGFDSGLRVGGPATAGAIDQVLPFARWCRENNVPVNFLSYHNYPQNEVGAYPEQSESPHRPGMFFVDRVRETKRRLQDEGYGDLPLFMTEWNTQAQNTDWQARWVGNEHVNDLFSGAAVCHLAHGCDEALDMMGFWVASDVFEEGGPQLEPYGNRYQYYGMLSVDGTPKASYHAFSFLNRLRGPRYALTLPDNLPVTRGVVVTDERSVTRALVWNCAFPTDEATEWTLSVSLPVPRTASARSQLRLTIATVREGQGSAWEFWKAMGAPPTLTQTEHKALAARALPAWSSVMMPVTDGKVTLELALKPNEFAFVELGGDVEGAAADHSAAMQALNQQLMT